MIKKFPFILFLFWASSAFAQTNQTNHIIILDKTGSMIGQAGGQDIWAQVKNAIKSYVNSVENNDKITVYTYAETVSEPKIFLISNESVKKDVNSFIDAVKADGKNTCTYKALKKVFEEYNTQKQGIPNLIYLYTDGLNNCSGYTMQEVANIFKAKRDDFDYLYYITLGLKLPKDVKEVAEGDSHIIPQEVPNPENLKNIVPKTIQLGKNTLVFNFTKDSIEVSQRMPFKTTGNINFEIELNCELQNLNIEGIELVTHNVQIVDNIGDFKIKIKKGTYFKNDIEGKIKMCVIKGNASLLADSFNIKLILPKKGKSTIKFE